jgi:NAD(P)-dependent dehydrogenase (short-subunit alcohol dehydrogenase family)
MNTFLNCTPKPGYRLVVVGACGGIGQAVVQAGTKLGLDIIAVDLDRSIAKAEPIQGVLYIGCDVSDEVQVHAAFVQIREKWGRIDGLVNLAGYTGERIPVASMSTQEWSSILNTNLSGMFFVAREAAALLQKSAEFGHKPGVVLISSTFGARVPHVGYAPYGVSKAGVMNLIRALATEWSPTVRVNGVAPGAINTAFLSGGTGRPEKETRLDMDRFLSGVPLKRLGEAIEIAGPILFLLSDAAAYMTGQTIHVNGGSWTP